jgi:hypothetical protein
MLLNVTGYKSGRVNRIMPKLCNVMLLVHVTKHGRCQLPKVNVSNACLVCLCSAWDVDWVAGGSIGV